MTKEELQQTLKRIIPENSIIILHVPEKEIDSLLCHIERLNKEIEKYSIKFIVCPDTIRVTVVRGGSRVRVEK